MRGEQPIKTFLNQQTLLTLLLAITLILATQPTTVTALDHDHSTICTANEPLIATCVTSDDSLYPPTEHAKLTWSGSNCGSSDWTIFRHEGDYWQTIFIGPVLSSYPFGDVSEFEYVDEEAPQGEDAMYGVAPGIASNPDIVSGWVNCGGSPCDGVTCRDCEECNELTGACEEPGLKLGCGGEEPEGQGVDTGDSSYSACHEGETEWTHTTNQNPDTCEWTCTDGHEKDGNGCIEEVDFPACGRWAQGTIPLSAESYEDWKDGEFCDPGTPDSSPAFPSPGSSENWQCWNDQESISCQSDREADTQDPAISFNPNSNTNWQQSHSTTVTITDNHEVAGSHYIWTSSSTPPSYSSDWTWMGSGSSVSQEISISSGSGSRYLHVRAYDPSNNVAITSSGRFRLDNTAPNIGFNPNGASWAQSHSVDITISDSHSGVSQAAAKWSTTQGDYSGLNSISASGQTLSISGVTGEYYMNVRADDNTGNTRTRASNTFYLDNTNPSLSVTGSSNEWHNEPRSASIYASDADAGVDQIRWNFNSQPASNCLLGGESKDCSGSSLCSETNIAAPEGDNTLYVCTRDEAGNTRSWLGTYRWETEDPQVSATGSSSEWYNTQRSATVQASDTGGSGLVEVRYSWNNISMNSACTSGGAVTSDGTTLNAPEGDNTLYLCARDGAGNTNTWSGTYNWETEDPTVSATGASSNWYNEQRTATIEASDTGGAGIEEVRYSWNNISMNSACTSGGVVTSNGATLNAPEEGTTLYLCIRDGAGNTNTWSGTYNWETEDPTVSATGASSNWYNEQRTATIEASDEGGSGLEEVRYSWNTSLMNSACTSGGTICSGGSCTTDAPEEGATLYVCARDGASNTQTTTGAYNWETTPPTCGEWTPNPAPWKATGEEQEFTLSSSTDEGGSSINTAGGTCIAGGNYGDTCTVTIDDHAGNTRTCTSPPNRVVWPPEIRNLQTTPSTVDAGTQETEISFEIHTNFTLDPDLRVDYTINFGDGRTETITGVRSGTTDFISDAYSHIYSPPGVYTVTVDVEDIYGQTDTDTTGVEATNTAPEITRLQATTTNGPAPYQTTYEIEINDESPEVTYTLTYSDSTSVTETVYFPYDEVYTHTHTIQYPTVTYSDEQTVPGVHTATLNIEDSYGLTDSDSTDVTADYILPADNPTNHARGHADCRREEQFYNNYCWNLGNVSGEVILIESDGSQTQAYGSRIDVRHETDPGRDLTGQANNNGEYFFADVIVGLYEIQATFLETYTNSTTQEILADQLVTADTIYVSEVTYNADCTNAQGRCDYNALGRNGCLEDQTSTTYEQQETVLRACDPVGSLGRLPGDRVTIDRNETHRLVANCCAQAPEWIETPQAEIDAPEADSLIKHTRLVNYLGEQVNLVIITWN